MEVERPKSKILSSIRISHIIAIALILRIIWSIFVSPHPVSDGLAYNILAQRISEGHGYSWPNGIPTTYWPVGTSALYAMAYSIFGYDLIWVSITNLVMGSLLVLAVYHLARTRFHESTALLAAAMAALWPTWIALTTIISSELPCTLFMAAGMAVALSRLRPCWLRTTIASALFVAAAYFRPTVLPLVFAVPALEAIMARDFKRAVLQTFLSVLVAGCLLAPWAMRNEQIFGEPVLVSANFGVNLWIGNNPDANGGYMNPPDVGADKNTQNEVAADRVYSRHALDYIRSNPADYLTLCVKRIKSTFDRETFAVAWNEGGLNDRLENPLKAIMTIYWIAIFASALIGLILFLKKDISRLFDPMLAASAIVIMPSILILSADRYHYSLMPFVATFGAYAIMSLVNRGRLLRA